MKYLIGLIFLSFPLFADEEVISPEQLILADQTTVEQKPVPDQQDDSVAAEQQPPSKQGSHLLTELKFGYYRFNSHKLREIYGAALDLQLSASYPVWKPLYIYGSVEYITARGKSRGGYEKTRVHIVPLSLGLQFVTKAAKDLKYYLTLGPRYYFFMQRNHSPAVDHHVNGNGLGGFVNTGFIYYLSSRWVIDVFGEYGYKRLQFHSHKQNVTGQSVQVGGLTLGGAIGYYW
jgi:outer membrane protein